MAAKKQSKKAKGSRKKTRSGSGSARRSGKAASKALKKKSKKVTPAKKKASRARTKVGTRKASRKVTRKKPVGKKATRKKSASKKAASPKATRKKSAGRKAARKKATSGARSPVRKSSRSRTPKKKAEPAPRRRLSTFNDAVKIYEAGVRLMHAEKFERARAEFDRLVSTYPAETELVDRSSVLIQACDNRLSEAGPGPRLKGANDYYEVGVAEMNSGALAEAQEHLEHALKLLPKADHILYALAAVAALRGERGQALDYLSRSIVHRDENRFLAVNDVDFESLSEDPDFLSLVESDAG